MPDILERVFGSEQPLEFDASECINLACTNLADAIFTTKDPFGAVAAWIKVLRLADPLGDCFDMYYLRDLCDQENFQTLPDRLLLVGRAVMELYVLPITDDQAVSGIEALYEKYSRRSDDFSPTTLFTNIINQTHLKSVQKRPPDFFEKLHKIIPRYQNR